MRRRLSPSTSLVEIAANRSLSLASRGASSPKKSERMMSGSPIGRVTSVKRAATSPTTFTFLPSITLVGLTTTRRMRLEMRKSCETVRAIGSLEPR